MACNCFNEVSLKMRARAKEALDPGDELAHADFAGRVLILANGDFCDVALPFEIRYHKKLRNGEVSQRLTKADTKVFMNFCPFCGEKFEGKASKSITKAPEPRESIE